MPRHRRGWVVGDHHEIGGRHSPLSVPILEPALLILINEQPQHGYSLLGELESWGLGPLHPSVVYRTLRDMEALEWIKADWDMDQSQGPPRKRYSITQQGEKILQNWQQELNKIRETISQMLKRIG